MKECAFGLVEKNPLLCGLPLHNTEKKVTCNHGAFQGVSLDKKPQGNWEAVNKLSKRQMELLTDLLVRNTNNFHLSGTVFMLQWRVTSQRNLLFYTCKCLHVYINVVCSTSREIIRCI